MAYNLYDWPEGLEITDLIPFDSVPEIIGHAANGLSARDIAVALRLDERVAAIFCRMAAVPGTPVFNLIERGRTEGRVNAMTKLGDVAREGNIDALKALGEIQGAIRFDELLINMDDDEFAC